MLFLSYKKAPGGCFDLTPPDKAALDVLLGQKVECPDDLITILEKLRTLVNSYTCKTVVFDNTMPFYLLPSLTMLLLNADNKAIYFYDGRLIPCIVPIKA